MSANDLYLTTEQDLTTVADAIRTRGGTSAALEYPDGFASAIAAIPGNVEVQEKDVNFYDYDGTLLYSYTKAQALLLSALPENPSHEGLTAQGWNWTLAEIQAELTTYPDQFIQVGQNYITTSGKTEVDFVLDDSNNLSPCLRIGVDGTVTIEWGDGTQETQTGENVYTAKYVPHTYSQTGSYTIKISTNDVFAFFSGSFDNAGVLQDGTNSDDMRTRTYSKNIKHIRIGNNFLLSGYAFANISSLKTITIPKGLDHLDSAQVFYNAPELKCVIAPYNNDISKIGQSFFGYCEKLETVSLSKKITELASTVFNRCGSLKRIGIPSSITTIGASEFSYCFNLEEIYLPAVTETVNNCFEHCYSLKKVKAPALTGDIKTYFYQNCYVLENATIPNNAENILAYAFQNCRSLQKIELPSTLEEIGNYAFNNNFTLKSVTIPANVTTIGNNAFSYCYGITEYHLKPTAPPTLGGSSVFSGIQSYTKIYVPAASVENYKTAQYWSTQASKIEAEPT